MRLSQGQLSLLETCPRKFQYTYLEQLGSPNSPEQQEKLTAGSRFHLLMQQWEMGLSIDSFLQEDHQLRQWFNAFVESAPKILAIAAQNLTFRQSEHVRTLEFAGHLFTVVYDLLILTEQEAQILDWKTYPKPQRSDRLAQSWQSRLYPFVMTETSHYTPEQISMTYWFFQSKGETESPRSLKFAYDSAKHEQIRQDLTQLLTQLTGWLDRYETQGEFFPQVSEAIGHCAECSFALRCQRLQEEQKGSISAVELMRVEAIEELPL